MKRQVHTAVVKQIAVIPARTPISNRKRFDTLDTFMPPSSVTDWLRIYYSPVF